MAIVLWPQIVWRHFTLYISDQQQDFPKTGSFETQLLVTINDPMCIVSANQAKLIRPFGWQ